jgi:hypothetical protein
MLVLHSRAVEGIRNPKFAVILGVSLLLGMTATVVSAQDGAGPRRLLALRLAPDERITIDGRLSEEPWTRAEAATGFRQEDPENGELATEQTEVRIVYDAKRLIIGVRCFDSDPTHLFGNQMQRDQTLDADDRFMLAIDTYSDGRSGYYFEINVAGAMGDGLVLPGGTSNGGNVNRSWDGIWLAHVQRDDRGWTAEIEIPLNTINFNPTNTSWGINFQRTIRRKAEETLWSGWQRNQGLTYMTAAGRLEGLYGLTQGIGVDVVPYAIASTSAAPGRGATAATQKMTGGGDIVYNATPGLRGNLSINTDFAETEVDQRQVNLTRFPLLFPEKRAFFLEGATLFDFGRDPSNVVYPFFSRRIGLDSSGTPQPIDYGAKLTGQAGHYDIGVLQVRTRANQNGPAEDFSVVRGRQRFWRQSYIGGIFTRRGNPVLPARQTAGADFSFLTPRFLQRNKVFEFSGFYLNTTKPAGTSGGAAYGVHLDFPNDPVMANVTVREVQDGYDPAVGFTNRRAYRQVDPDFRYTLHFNHSPVIRRISWETEANLFYNLEGVLETNNTDFQLVRVQLQSNDFFEFHLSPNYERLPRNFEIHSGVVLPAGSEYTFLRRRFQVQTANRRAVALNARWETGSFYDGGRRQVTGTVSFRPHRGWLINFGGDYNRIDLKEGHFTTRAWTNDVNVQLSPFISIVDRLQFDTVTRQIGWQARFRWIITPGDDIYVVWSQNWSDIDTLRTLDRRGSVKVVKTIRF